MTLEAFEAALDRYGGELALWPEAERTVAQGLLDASPAARRSLAALHRAEAALARRGAAPLADPGRLAAVAMQRRQQRPAARVSGLMAWAAAASAALALGLAAGAAPGGVDGPRELLSAAFAVGAGDVG